MSPYKQHFSIGLLKPMADPFAIEIFSTTGDPEGVRLIQKTNWSGIGVVFPRSMVAQVLAEEHADRPGVYVLVGDAADETLYIGEADPVGHRIKQHVANKENEWTWAVFFVDSHNFLGKTEIQFLESELIKIVRSYGTAILTNRNVPTRPNMSRKAQAVTEIFLREMLLIMPMIGIKGFSDTKKVDTFSTIAVKQDDSDLYDTIVVPAREEGFKRVFLGENCWYSIRIGENAIPRLKYIAAYQVAPISAVTHVAEVADIKPYQDSGKYIVKFKSPAQPITPIKLDPNDIGARPQSPRYTNYRKLKSAKKLSDLWNWV